MLYSRYIYIYGYDCCSQSVLLLTAGAEQGRRGKEWEEEQEEQMEDTPIVAHSRQGAGNKCH